MTYNKPQEKNLEMNQKTRSDGSELIPAEVQANIRQEKGQTHDGTVVSGLTVDDEGLLNNYAVEPEVYPSEYPSSRQQRRYIVLGAGAALFVVALVLISFFVS